MQKLSLLLVCAAAALAGCATGPASSSAERKTTTTSSVTPYDGVWNSVLGYHGPSNTVNLAAGPQ